MVEFLKQLEDDTSGATAIEYGLVVALVFLAIVTSVNAFGAEAIEMWNMIESTSEEAVDATVAPD